VCSAPIEKPHLSSWRPILECGFDLAYSPLMELDYGKGRLVLCTLDLEDHAAGDPVALWMGRKVMVYAMTAPLQPKTGRPVCVLEGAAEALVKALGVVYERPAGAHRVPELLVNGPLAAANRPVVERAIGDGQRIVFLARKQPEGEMGVGLELVKGFGGSLEAPAWPECRGLSASDLRWRTEADAWLVKSGAEAGAKGLLGRRAIGKGVALFCQLDPGSLDTDRDPSLRPTRWRQTRALAQLLANLGASFKADSRFFHLAEGGAPLYHPDRGAGDEPPSY
jgi:beta-galactosidase